MNIFKKLFLSLIVLCSIVILSDIPAQTTRQIVSNAGTYSSIVVYAASDLVSYNGSFYISLIANNVGNTPSSSPTDWSTTLPPGCTSTGSGNLTCATLSASTSVSAPSLISGTSAGAKAALPTGAHGMPMDETSTGGVPAASVDYIRSDSTSHRLKQSLNGGAEVNVPIPSEIPAAQVAANLASSGSTGVTGNLPITQVGSAGLSGANGISVAPTGVVSGSALTPATVAATTSVTAPLYATTTKCAAAGSGASPSLVACSAAPAGVFSCATNASGATCVVSTTAVTASSVIQIQPDSSLGTALSVTCNTTADSALTGPRVSARTVGTSFTIKLGTFTTNPECFSYIIIN